MEFIMIINISEDVAADLSHLDCSVNEYLILTGELTMDELYNELHRSGEITESVNLNLDK